LRSVGGAIKAASSGNGDWCKLLVTEMSFNAPQFLIGVDHAGNVVSVGEEDAAVALARDDPRQNARAETFVSKGAWVSHIVLVEVIGVLDAVFQLGHKQLPTAVDMLLNHRDLVLQDPEVITAALARFRRRPKLGFSDCMVLESARKAGHVPLATFDKELSRLDDVERL
jgi:predicted nucleic-acid-binding protein